jgi:acyl-CoA reductase-like NAD-dependent aldehyde dehydrogenase
MVEKLQVGMPEDDADITPVVSESSANFIEGLVNDAREKGGLQRVSQCLQVSGLYLGWWPA